MGPPYEIQTFDSRKLRGRRWYFRLVDTGNWETIAQSEGYNSKAARDDTVEQLRASTGWPAIPERKKR